MHASRLVLGTILVWIALGGNARAQDERSVFVGALAGVSALSADSRAITNPPDASVSLYAPENGLALNLFAGLHVSDYFSLQANYVWNRNDLTLVSTSVTGLGGATYDQRRSSAQHAVVADALVYFRKRHSRIRPYLGTGLAVVHFASSEVAVVSSGLAVPPREFSSTRPALRSHVGIDIRISPALSFRYSFSETIGGNPISRYLTPPGKRGLANFQNLFGILTRW